VAHHWNLAKGVGGETSGYNILAPSARPATLCWVLQALKPDT